MPITNAKGDLVYEAKGEFSFLIPPTWRITDTSGSEHASIRRKVFAWSPTWLIVGDLGEFQIRRKVWSWVRKYQVIGGTFDGAEMIGNFWDLKFKITYKLEDIAQAQGKILTLRDTHNIEVLKDDPQSTLLTAITMVALHLDRKDEQNERNQHSA